MANYSSDRRWSDRFIPSIKYIVGPYLLVESDFEVDAHQAADLVVMRARDMMIAARVRRPGYADRYPFEFTIRAMRDNGVKTELSKITEGWGDWLFYGHAANDTGAISRWYLVDLHAWRAHMIRNRNCIKRGIKPNGDGTHFAWFDLRSFPSYPPILVASSDQSVVTGGELV